MGLQHCHIMNKASLFFAIFILSLINTGRVSAGGEALNLSVRGVIEDAPECTINGNDMIDVDFGDAVYSQKIDGLNYKRQKLIYNMSCSNMLSTSLKVKVVSTSGEGFESGMIGTNRDGLAIRLYSDNGVLHTDEFLNFTYNNDSGGPNIYAVLAAKETSELVEGTFSGAGTLVILYQ
ncbi:hypothetical protein L8O48_17590 [Enterobacter cloacae]|uniref:fimbrial protein n=1 Tax=Enterobacter cloacae TaxID=550 RepID=UPI002004D3B2|nr:fimbrial protein [Enterobacter cloacae]MCK7268877.1 hypothetical protein [Enterobacter cloacae]